MRDKQLADMPRGSDALARGEPDVYLKLDWPA
jgi:hypothetical protein